MSAPRLDSRGKPYREESSETLRDALLDEVHGTSMALVVYPSRLDAIISAARSEVYAWVAQNEAKVHAQRDAARAESDTLRAALEGIRRFVVEHGEMVHPDKAHPAIGVRMVSVAGVRNRIDAALAPSPAEPAAPEREP